MQIIYEMNQRDFGGVPGNPICYWASKKAMEYFEKQILSDVCEPKCGLKTGITEKYVHSWQEVGYNEIGFGLSTRTEALSSKRKWFPISNGQEYRKWYGNNYDVVYWENDGHEIRNLYCENGKLKSRPQNMNYYFKQGLTWSALTSKELSLRINPLGNIISGAGYGLFNNQIDLFPIMALLNSKIANHFSNYLSGTLNFEVGVLSRLPISNDIFSQEISNLAKTNVVASKDDWDSFEISWDFKKHPLI